MQVRFRRTATELDLGGMQKGGWNLHLSLLQAVSRHSVPQLYVQKWDKISLNLGAEARWRRRR
jgi:hypothetical protein